MEEKKEIINRVAASPLVTMDLEEYYPEGERVTFDIKEILYQGMVLKEKEFREYAKSSDWSGFTDKNVAITCSADSIIPVWAYMIVGTKISPYARHYVFGNLYNLELSLWKESLSKLNPEKYSDAKIVIKGCGRKTIPEHAFLEATRILWPYVSSIMYGEPCSTVPVYKRPAKS
jgi:hypothetical protein